MKSSVFGYYDHMYKVQENWFQRYVKVKKKEHEYFLYHNFPFGMSEDIRG